MMKLFFLLILIIILFIILYKYRETFVNVKIESDFYVPNDINIDLSGKKINASRICIYKMGYSQKNLDDAQEGLVELSQIPKEVIDYECIDVNSLMPVLNMPNHRKNTVCLDGNCLTKNDLLFLKGNNPFKLSTRSNLEYYNGNCLGGNYQVKLRKCGNNIQINNDSQNNVTAFHPVGCTTDEAYSYNLLVGDNQDKNLNVQNIKNSYKPNSSEPLLSFVEGHAT